MKKGGSTFSFNENLQDYLRTLISIRGRNRKQAKNNDLQKLLWSRKRPFFWLRFSPTRISSKTTRKPIEKIKATLKWAPSSFLPQNCADKKYGKKC